MKKKVFFLVNTLEEFDFGSLIKKHLNNVDVSIGESLPMNMEYDLIILWSYRKILPQISHKKNIVIFHSSNLPDGKGWAPIYYSIANDYEFYTISGILPIEKVDSGNIVVRARFRIQDNYTAEYIRQWDKEISIMLTKQILDHFDGREIQGIEQIGKETFWKRRCPEDNEININESLQSRLTHLRACEKTHPAFFWYKKIKYNIFIEPDIVPTFPKEIEVIFFDTSQ